MGLTQSGARVLLLVVLLLDTSLSGTRNLLIWAWASRRKRASAVCEALSLSSVVKAAAEKAGERDWHQS
jgi:hypothetical protein